MHRSALLLPTAALAIAGLTGCGAGTSSTPAHTASASPSASSGPDRQVYPVQVDLGSGPSGWTIGLANQSPGQVQYSRVLVMNHAKAGTTYAISSTTVDGKIKGLRDATQLGVAELSGKDASCDKAGFQAGHLLTAPGATLKRKTVTDAQTLPAGQASDLCFRFTLPSKVTKVAPQATAETTILFTPRT